MRIIYNNENETANFDIDKFYKSLNKYGEVSKEAIEKELENWHYDPLHYSCLVEIGVKLLPDEESARAYYNDHAKENQDFESLQKLLISRDKGSSIIESYKMISLFFLWNNISNVQTKRITLHSF